MSAKIFFTDLDGTLLNEKGVITENTRDAIKRFIARGNKFAICTGRPLPSAIEVFKSLNIPDKNCYVIAFSGAQIYDCEEKKTLYRCSLDSDTVTRLFELGDECDIYCQAYSDTDIICKKNTECTKYYTRVIHLGIVESDDIISALPEPTCKLVAIEFKDWSKMERFQQRIDEEFKGRVTANKSNKYYVDIFSSEAGKGNSIHMLCRILGIPVENSIGAGDEANDLTLIQEAGTSIAMCNGNDEVKAAADIITQKDNAHDGLVEYIDQF